MDSGEKDEIKELGREIIELDTKLLAQETGMVFGDTHPLRGKKSKQHYADVAKKHENKLKEVVCKLDKSCQLDVASEVKPTYYEFAYKPEKKVHLVFLVWFSRLGIIIFFCVSW